MKILVIGSGGREHALAWKLSQSARVEQVFVAPGNAGTARVATNVPLAAGDLSGLLRWATDESIDLTVVGPDNALAAGIVDLFEAAGRRIFGPRRAGARLEWSKSFAKSFMVRHGIPTARYVSCGSRAEARSALRDFTFPVAVKADGLALGKGVVIARDFDEADRAMAEMMEQKRFGEAGSRVVLEEFLTGTECSLHALVDGRSALLLPTAQDHKPLYEGNRGPNTGGMGAFSPSNKLGHEGLGRVEKEVLSPFLRGLREEALEYRGLLFPGLMLTAGGPRVLEFNCRFGDPETQVLLPRLESDLVDLLEATLDGRLEAARPVWSQRAAVCVVAASQGYPGDYETGKPITGLDQLDEWPDVTVFHAGTRQDGKRTVTAGGRVLAVTALGPTLPAARQRAYEAVEQIAFDGRCLRRDIGLV